MNVPARPGVEFRPFRSSDGVALADLHRRAVLEVAVAAIDADIAASWVEGLTPEGYARAVDHGEVFEVAACDGTIVGFCSTRRNEIAGLYVCPGFVRRGIGAALLTRAENRLRAKGYSEIVLTSSLYAVPFYRRHGFDVVEEALRATRGALSMRVVDMHKPAVAPWPPQTAPDPPTAPSVRQFHNMSYANRDDREAMPSCGRTYELIDLLALMAALRTPVTGCPWDLEQSFATIAPYTIEEAYEVADAIARADMIDLVDELGDLLLQVVYHARLAEEASAFAFPDVVAAICEKLIRRHPHVFGDEAARSAGMAKGTWERIKADEKRTKAARRAGAVGRDRAIAPPPDPPSVLEGVPLALPALTRAVKLQEKAGRVGFDWRSADLVLAKLVEETEEIRAALAAGDHSAVAGEIGDLFFVVANLARHLAVDPEQALRATNDKFMRRFRHIETRLAAGGSHPAAATLAEMDRLWDEAKALERER